MTAIPAHSAAAPPHHANADEHEHEHLSFIKRWFFSTDHKIIGIEFLFLGLAFFLVGGLLAMLVRWQLAYPGKAIPWFGVYMDWPDGKMPPEYYNQAFTMHATIMIFFVIIPILVGAFGNYLIPLMIGARDMAFPFLNGMAFWLALPAGAIMVAAFFLPGGAASAGWTSYPPLSSTYPSGVSYLDRNPYVGTTPLVDVRAAYSAAQARVLADPSPDHRAALTRATLALAVQPLRLTRQGASLDIDTAGESPTSAQATYSGSAERLLAAARQALLDNDYMLDPGASAAIASGTRVGTAGEPAAHAAITVADGKISVIADANAPGLLTHTAALLNWQSNWAPASLITVTLAWFLSFLYIAAYQVRTGIRAVNWVFGAILAAVAAYFVSRLTQYLVFDGQSAWFFSLFLLGFSSIMGSLNYLTTIVKLRCPGMAMFRMPLTVWAMFITSIMVLLATPVLAAALFMNLLDHHRLTSFFLPYNWTAENAIQSNSGGGFPLLHQHLFWFYSHPAVYIMILPAMGMVSDILAVNSRKPVFGYRPMIYALSAIAFLGFIVWAHHMFQSGLNPTLGTSFAISTMFIAVPSAIKVFNWLGTIWGGNIRYNTPMLHAVAFVSMFVIGGMSGIYMASTAVDVHIHGTYFIVAHIHYVLFGASMFGIFAGITHWYPKMFGRMMNDTLGKTHFWISFVAFNLTFFPMHILGLHGAPRRVAEFSSNYSSFASFHPLNVFITHAAFLLGAAQLILVVNFIGSWFFGKRAGENPWLATTLDWQTPSPPPHGNFAAIPLVYFGPYEYASPIVEEDHLLQTRLVEVGDAVVAH